MNGFFLLRYILLSSLFISCINSNKPIEKTLAVEKTDFCSADTSNTYEVYVPESAAEIEKFPLLIILDAHGSGQFALNKFKKAAHQYPVILVASNLVKNGYTNFDEAIQTMLTDVKQKYPVGETIFITGFSGGARMALTYALKHPLDGLLMCGALANANQIKSLQCPVFSISGTDDFNFVETAQFLFQEQSIPKNLKIDLISASHSWPDSNTLADAFGFLYLSAPDNPVKSKSQRIAFNNQQKSRIELLETQGEFVKAFQLARNMCFTEPFCDDKTFATTYNRLKESPGLSRQLNTIKKYLSAEMNIRQPYIDALTTKDTTWWRNEVRSIQTKIETEQESYAQDMYRRIKAFWGIACYSLSNQATREHNEDMLSQIVSVYKILDPENPDVYYFSAFIYYWHHNHGKCLFMLEKAVDFGYADFNRLKSDFPESITSKIDVLK